MDEEWYLIHSHCNKHLLPQEKIMAETESGAAWLALGALGMAVIKKADFITMKVQETFEMIERADLVDDRREYAIEDLQESYYLTKEEAELLHFRLEEA